MCMAKVDLEKFSKEELEKIVSECFDKTELAIRLGFTYANGRVHKEVMALIEKFGISTNHFDKSKKVKARRKYPVIEKICPVCGTKFETQEGHPRETFTCSYKCANVLFAAQKHTPEANQKRSVFMRENIKNGVHTGWTNRHNAIPSFAEKTTIEILDELNITHLQREYKCWKWYIDFADVNRKIAIEIDGSQHELPERKAKDIEKDKYLTDLGWKIFRIKWNSCYETFILNSFNI